MTTIDGTCKPMPDHGLLPPPRPCESCCRTRGSGLLTRSSRPRKMTLQRGRPWRKERQFWMRSDQRLAKRTSPPRPPVQRPRQPPPCPLCDGRAATHRQNCITAMLCSPMASDATLRPAESSRNRSNIRPRTRRKWTSEVSCGQHAAIGREGQMIRPGRNSPH